MNRFRLFTVASILMFALPAVAQPATTQAHRPAKDEHGQGAMPSVDRHLKVLAEKLDLNADQQVKAKPILQEMQDATQKLLQDESISLGERHAKVKAQREKADKKLREILNDEQKKKLDQFEQ